MRILLTGASGFIGKHLLRALLDEGHQVVCAVRKPRPSQDPRLSYLHADFTKDTDKSAWLARLSQVDAVINAVGIFREQGAQTFDALHVRTPRALFAACAESDHVHMVIQLSALGADEAADTPYHLSKKAADDYLATLPVRAAIVQPSLVYGPDGASARAFRAIASLPFALRLGRAPQPVQPIHVDDVAAAIVALLRQRLYVDAATNRAEASMATPTARRIALVGPQALPFVDYLAALRSAMGMGKLRVVTLPGVLARARSRRSGAGCPAACSIRTRCACSTAATRPIPARPCACWAGRRARSPPSSSPPPPSARAQNWTGCCRYCGCRSPWSGSSPRSSRPLFIRRRAVSICWRAPASRRRSSR